MRKMRAVGVGLVTAAAIALLNVAWKRPTRLAAGASDTLTIVTTRPLWLNVRVVNFAGHALPQSDMRFAFAGGDSLPLTPDGQLTCERRSDANVSVTGGAVSALLTILCRPIVGVAFNPGMRFIAGGPSQSVAITPLGPDQRPVLLRAPRVRLGDDSVARLNGTSIEPHMPGITWADVVVGDCVQTIEIAVDDTVPRPDDLVRPFTLYQKRLSGTSATSQLPAGRYELWLRSDSGVTDGYAFRVDASCKRLRGIGQRLECSATRALVATAEALPGAGHSVLSIRRLPDSSLTRSMAIARIARRLESHSADCDELDCHASTGREFQ
jgi:hypothetical protein